MPAAPDFSHAYLKLDRASEHMHTVAEQTRAFLKRNPAPLGVRTEMTEGPGEGRSYVLKAVIRQEPPRMLGLAIGDAIQNIRHALDYMVYELSPRSRRKQGKTQFPIFGDRCRFEVLGEPMIRGIKGTPRAVIERYQPYNAGYPPGNDPLAILQRLANQDKHRLLLPVAAAVSEAESWIGHDSTADLRITEFNPGPVEDDATIMAFTVTPKFPGADMDVYPQSALHISLADTGTVGLRMDVGDLLGLLYHHVREMILELGFQRGIVPPDPG